MPLRNGAVATAVSARSMDTGHIPALQLVLVTSDEGGSGRRVRVGRLLREARIERGDTAAVVGERLGVSQQRVAQWENGDGRPPVERADAIATYLGLSLAEVLLLIHADHTGRPAIEPSLTRSLDVIEETLKQLMLKQEQLAERLELVTKPDEDLHRD